jgi:cold shock CspA family protein
MATGKVINDGQAVTYELTEQRGKEAASEIQLA